MNDTKNRPVVGIMTGSFNSDYPRTLISELQKALGDEDVDIHLYTGMESTLFFGDYSSFDVGFDRHWLSVFEYSNFDKIDLLIVAYGNIMSSHPHIDADSFLPKLPQVPTVMVGNATVNPQAHYLMVDNYLGMKANVDHLIEVHGYRDIAFISGPKGSPSADLRMEAYLDSLTEHGMPIRDGLIVYGDYSNNVDPVVEELFAKNERIDAIVSSNDEMCNAVYRVAKKHGRKVGADLAVVGFDDEEYAKEMDPPLTTVKQDYAKVAEGLVEMIHTFRRGGELSSMRIPASCVQRSSCGCSYETVSMKLAGNTGLNPERYMSHNEQHAMFQRNMIAALVLRNLLTESVSRRAFFTELAKEFREIGVKSSYILLLENPTRLAEGEEFILPDTLRLYMRQDGEKCEGFDRDDAPTVGRGEIGRHIGRRERQTRTSTFLLFYGEYQYGVLTVEIEPDEVLYFYALSLQVGSGLRYLELALRQKEVADLLEHQNELLDYAATHDKMTGLYNRMGAMERIPKFMREQDAGRQFVSVMADLDHLKQINDTFGHDVGDEAICKVAEILTECLPKGSPIGRNGGDEFIAMYALGHEGQPQEIAGRIRRACEEYNQTAGKPYYLGISVGSVSFVFMDGMDLSVISKKADERLYEAKRHRRDNVIRGWAR